VLIIGLVNDWNVALAYHPADLAAQNVISCLWKTASRWGRRDFRELWWHLFRSLQKELLSAARERQLAEILETSPLDWHFAGLPLIAAKY
jgi:hypothetical protein